MVANPTPVVGFTPRHDGGQSPSHLTPSGSEMSIVELGRTPISPLSLAFRKTGSVPKVPPLKIATHRRSFSEEAKLNPDTTGHAACLDWARASHCSGIPIPIPDSRRSQNSDSDHSTVCGDVFNCAPSCTREPMQGSFKHPLWDYGSQLARQGAAACQSHVDVVEEDDETLNDCMKDQDIFDLEIPVPELPFLGRLARIKTHCPTSRTR